MVLTNFLRRHLSGNVVIKLRVSSNSERNLLDDKPGVLFKAPMSIVSKDQLDQPLHLISLQNIGMSTQTGVKGVQCRGAIRRLLSDSRHFENCSRFYVSLCWVSRCALRAT